MKDIKHIIRDFHSVAYVMPLGWDLGVPWGGGGVGGQKCFPNFNQIWCVSYLYKWHIYGTIFIPAPLGLGEGPKGQISLNLNYKVNFKDVLTNLC